MKNFEGMDERQRAGEAALEVWIEEQLGAVQVPDLVAAVRARVARGAAREIDAPAERRSRQPWLWAAVLLIGCAAVAGTVWMQRFDAAGPRQEPAGGTGERQDPEPTRPGSVAEALRFLVDATRLEIRPFRSGDVPLDPRGAGTPHVVEVDDADRAWLRDVAARARPVDQPAGWEWTHQIDVYVRDGRFLRVALDPSGDTLGVQGFGDLVIRGGRGSRLAHHVADAERAARFEQARLQLGDLQAFFEWSPAADWDGRLAVWGANEGFVTQIDGYAWSDRLRALDLRGSRVPLSGVVPRLPALRELRELRELRWPGSIDAESLRRLGSLPELRILTPGGANALAVSNPANSETRALAAALLDLVALDRFEELDLSWSRWDDAWFGDVEPAARIPPDARLDVHLEGTGLGARFLGSIAARGRHVTGLWAEQSSVDDDALRALRGAAEAGALRQVDLSRCVGVTPEGLGKLLDRARLRTLRLVETPCDLATLRRIPESQSELVSLDLGWLPGDVRGAIDDDLVRELALLPRLEVLSLRGRGGWSDAGLAALAKAPALRTLDVSRCPGITAGGLAALRSARPELAITSDEDG